MAKYALNAPQYVALNTAAIYENVSPCPCGNVVHENMTGQFILKGPARYRVTARQNISVPTGGTVGQIAVALAVNGEARPTTKAIVTPAAVEENFATVSEDIVTVPCGCCFSVSVRSVAAVDDTTVTPAPGITFQNATVEIQRLR